MYRIPARSIVCNGIVFLFKLEVGRRVNLCPLPSSAYSL